jgi:Carboxypeptidase regulatory-like domain
MMTMKKMPTTRKRKTTSSPSTNRLLHPFFAVQHPIVMRFFLAAGLLLLTGVHTQALLQESTAQTPPAPDKKASALQQACLLYGNVFTAEGKLLPDADVHVRRAADKRPKWSTASDRRGEFAVRVPPGSDYVIEIRAKGFVTQTKTVTAQSYSRLDLVFHMDPSQDKKK